MLSMLFKGRMAVLGMTQTQLSKETGIPRVTLNRFLNGKRRISHDKIELIFSALGLTVVV